MAKKRCCSICHNEGHNSRTCNFRDPPEDNSAPEATSEDNHSGLQPNLTFRQGLSIEGSASSQQPQPPELEPESNNNNSREVQINKGERWSPEEHMGFLKGIQILGKGAWKAISENYVRTRTANQISSHAQKYFKRMKNPLRRKRNPSIFDIRMDEKPQHSCIHYVQLYQISRHRQLHPNNRLHPLSPSPNPGTREPLDGVDRPSSGDGDMQIDEGEPLDCVNRPSSGDGDMQIDEGEPLDGVDRPSSGDGDMQIDEGKSSKDGQTG